LGVRDGAQDDATQRLTLAAAAVCRLGAWRALIEDVLRAGQDQLGLRGCHARSERAQQASYGLLLRRVWRAGARTTRSSGQHRATHTTPKLPRSIAGAPCSGALEEYRAISVESEAALKHVTIYTDGACLGNPGPGGYGVVLVYGSHRKELAGGYRLTTNNRMELTAAIRGLAALKGPCYVELFSDSQYVVHAVEKSWARRWRANGWYRSNKERAENRDLWAELLTLCDRHEVRFKWIKGHAGHVENERCDQLAFQAAQLPHLPEDEGYRGGGSHGS
jgi:ribonuclease HI